MGADEPDEPRWFYVGNGELRLKEGEDWTDQYQAIESRHAAVPQTDLAVKPDPRQPPRGARSRGGPRRWLAACASLAVVVGTAAAAAHGSLKLDGLQSLMSPSASETVTASAKGASSPSLDGGGYTKADYAKNVGKIPVLVGTVREDAGHELATHIDLMSLGFQFDAIGRLPAPPRVDPAWWAATNTKLSQLSQQAAVKWASGDQAAAMAHLEVVVKSSNTMITKVNTAFGIHIPPSKTAA